VRHGKWLTWRRFSDLSPDSPTVFVESLAGAGGSELRIEQHHRDEAGDQRDRHRAAAGLAQRLGDDVARGD